MVSSATNLTRNGLTDFLVQRVTAMVLAVYTLLVTGFLVMNPGLGYDAWVGFHGSWAMVLVSTLAILSTAAHAWIGMWTIGTDYLREAHVGPRATLIRGLYQVLGAGVLFLYVAWGLQIFWGL